MKTYVIADRDGWDDDGLIARVARLSALGADFIQLRDKRRLDRSFEALARSVRDVCRGALIINTHAQVALRVGADGVHLPSGVPLPERAGLMIGRSCHSVADCERAAAEEAEYVLFGPVFDTRSKVSRAAVTLDDLRSVADLGPAVFALGGIRSDTLSLLQSSGATGIAAITLYMRDEPIDEIMTRIRTL